MSRSKLASSVFAVAAMALVGCGNDIVGDWEEVDPICLNDGRFTVDDDLNVDGTMYLPDGTGSCLTCPFNGDVEDDGDDKYTADIRFDTCNCNGDYTARANCRMNDDGDELRCTLDLGTCGQLDGDWRKRD